MVTEGLTFIKENICKSVKIDLKKHHEVLTLLIILNK